jgi:hypothetical protein
MVNLGTGKGPEADKWLLKAEMMPFRLDICSSLGETKILFLSTLYFVFLQPLPGPL